MTNFKNHNDEIRCLAAEEFLVDFKSRNLYLSKKILPDCRISYFRGLTESLLYGSINDFIKYLSQHNCLTEVALKVENAAWSLAYNEFKRYYIRGVCKHAINQKKLLRVCRFRTSKSVSEDSGNLINEILRPESMLNVARKVPGSSNEGRDSVEQRILRPNSGLCVEISRKLEKVKTLNNEGESNE